MKAVQICRDREVERAIADDGILRVGEDLDLVTDEALTSPECELEIADSPPVLTDR